MNVMLINYEYPPIGGGAGNATMFIARALLGLGHSPTVLTSAYAQYTGIRDEAGVRVHRIRAKRRNAARASAVEMLSFVLSALKAAPAIATAEAIEAIIVFFALPCGPVALRLHRTMKLPYVVSLRGGDVPGLVPEIAWQHWLLRPLRRHVLGASTAIVANDTGLASLSARADPFPVRVIPNGVDAEFFRPPEPHPVRAGAMNMLFVGRFHRQKNLAFLLNQLARLPDSTQNGWRLALAGDGDERPALEAQARRLGIADRLVWHGWQEDKSRLLDLYQRADILVNPSLYEGMPNVVLEAMACGLPVLASDIPGNNSLVLSRETGLLFPVANGDAFCAALAELRENPEFALALGRGARRRVEADFTWKNVARRYVELFAQ